MAAVQRRLPGPDEYPGKHFVWNDAATARMIQLVEGNTSCGKTADILNVEFAQPIKLTRCSVISKINRIRKAN
jgi:hypothetical protein